MLRQSDVAAWATRELGHKISQSIISDTLKPRFSYLDTKSFPGFSNGWLTGFKRRHHIKQYKQSGESGSADIVGSQEQVSHVKSLIAQFGPNNTFNADETALFWLLLPDRTLATKAQSGTKKKKDRITVLVRMRQEQSSWTSGFWATSRSLGLLVPIISTFEICLLFGVPTPALG